MARALIAPERLEEHPVYVEVANLRDRVLYRQRLRQELASALKAQRRLPEEIAQLETQALEKEGQFLLGDASREEVARVQAELEHAQGRFSGLSEQINALKKEIAGVDDKAEVKRYERAREELARVARVQHEPLMREAVSLLRKLTAVQKKDMGIRDALVQVGLTFDSVPNPNIPNVGDENDGRGSPLYYIVQELRKSGYEV